MTTAADFHRAWHGLPQGTLDNVTGSGTCIVLAPHPDDESLGCGGLIAACAAAGRPPLVVVLTDGTGSHPNSRAFPPNRLRDVRAAEVRDALTYLGLSADRVVHLNETDTKAPTGGPRFDAIVERLVALVRQERHCTSILAPWRHDPHCDHEAASLAAAAVAEAAGIAHVAYPVWGWTLAPETPIASAPGPGFRLRIGAFLSAKRAAVQAHRSQYGDLITDDPTGFRLPAGLLSVFDSPFETFVRA